MKPDPGKHMMISSVPDTCELLSTENEPMKHHEPIGEACYCGTERNTPGELKKGICTSGGAVHSDVKHINL